ncbi:hypothetical protein [Caulobacter phage ERS]|uniref:Uncharacterized protein n=1 Tax=Caulobacter phage ERS TaxID=3020392 RepID=A0AAF0B410_9CAUD|nr:hypothetical protein [Caulobacter phage ERS]
MLAALIVGCIVQYVLLRAVYEHGRDRGWAAALEYLSLIGRGL